MVVDVDEPYCNLKVFRVDHWGDYDLECERHNLILDSGMSQLRQASIGQPWKLQGFGLGSNGAAVVGSQTWGQTPLLVSMPTSSYYLEDIFRMSFMLPESSLNGSTLREAWVSPDTLGPGSGGLPAYARVVFPAISKTSDYAYLFLFDCGWGV